MQLDDFAKFNGTVVNSKVKPILQDRVDPKTLESISKLPDKINQAEPPLSERLLSFKSQQAYLESLNLREVCYQTFSTLQDSINKV